MPFRVIYETLVALNSNDNRRMKLSSRMMEICMVMVITTMKGVKLLYLHFLWTCLMEPSSCKLEIPLFKNLSVQMKHLDFFYLHPRFKTLRYFFLSPLLITTAFSAGEFVVHKAGAGIRSFQSAITDKFICVTADEITCKVNIFA